MTRKRSGQDRAAMTNLGVTSGKSMNGSQKRVCQPSRSEAVFCHKAVKTTYCHRPLQSYSEITLHGRVIEHTIIYVRHFDTHLYSMMYFTWGQIVHTAIATFI